MATPLIHAVYAVVLAATAAAESPAEPPECRPVRAEHIARAIVEAGRGSPTRAARLLTVGEHETHWSWLVHHGRCELTRWKCDEGKAASLWQLHVTASFPRPEWLAVQSASLEATTRAALEADARLERAARVCRARGLDSIEATFSLYGSGNRCDLAMPRRIATFDRMIRKLGSAPVLPLPSEDPMFVEPTARCQPIDPSTV